MRPERPSRIWSETDLLERCERIRHFDSLRPPFSLIRRDSAANKIAWTAAHGTGVIVNSPMQSARSPEQIDGWIDAVWLELTQEDLNDIAFAIERTGAGSGPRRP